MENRSQERSPSQHGRHVKVNVNGEPLDVRESCSVEALLDFLDMKNRRVAVAVNRRIVPRSNYAAVQLCDGDRIEMLEAVGGG